MLTFGPTVVVVTSMPDRRVTYVSPNLRRELGIDPAALTRELPLAQRVHPDDLQDARAMLDAVAEGAFASGSAEYRIADDTREYRWVSATIIPLDSNPDGHDVAGESLILTYLVDIDKRRRAEEELRAATQAAEAANLSKSQFLSRMSHELRTPLNAIIGFGQLLELDDLTDVQRDSVDHVLKGGRHLLTLINEVLDISRVEAGELTLSPEAVLASDVLDDAVSLIRPLAQQRGITVHVDTGACACHVFADRQRVKQVLLNLLSNAIKYNRAQGSILVRCEQTPTSLRIDVRDTGIGIAADRLDLLFTPFERLGAEQTGEEGTGIGLALSKKLTEAMGGTLTASSIALGQGSTFSLTLPRVEGPVERVERLGGLPGIEIPSSDQRAVVLHVEDNASNVTLVERILSVRPNVQVVATMQGTLGVELARQHRPAVVLLDLHLPDLDGEEVLRQLRDHPETSTVPVVIVSADATRGQVQRILSAGAAAYLTKPIDVRDLLRVVDDAVLAASGPAGRP